MCISFLLGPDAWQGKKRERGKKDVKNKKERKINNSCIKRSENGKKTLIVFYDNKKADFDEQTEIALKRHGLPKNTRINILCLPNHGTRQTGKLDKQGFTGMADDK